MSILTAGVTQQMVLYEQTLINAHTEDHEPFLSFRAAKNNQKVSIINNAFFGSDKSGWLFLLML
jgi:hypothetical protein